MGEEFRENRVQEAGSSDLYVPVLFRDAQGCSTKGTESISICNKSIQRSS